jgi:hypothetical protein
MKRQRDVRVVVVVYAGDGVVHLWGDPSRESTASVLNIANVPLSRLCRMAREEPKPSNVVPIRRSR